MALRAGLVVPPIITLWLAKPIVDEGSFFVGFWAIIPRMFNISKTSHIMCESKAWAVPFIASLSWARSSSLFIKRSILRQAYPYPLRYAYLFVIFFLPPALIRHHFIDESHGSINDEERKAPPSAASMCPLDMFVNPS
jgi:hypothetical protein